MILFSFFFHLCQFTQHLPLPLPVPQCPQDQCPGGWFRFWIGRCRWGLSLLFPNKHPGVAAAAGLWATFLWQGSKIPQLGKRAWYPALHPPSQFKGPDPRLLCGWNRGTEWGQVRAKKPAFWDGLSTEGSEVSHLEKLKFASVSCSEGKYLTLDSPRDQTLSLDSPRDEYRQGNYTWKALEPLHCRTQERMEERTESQVFGTIVWYAQVFIYLFSQMPEILNHSNILNIFKAKFQQGYFHVHTDFIIVMIFLFYVQWAKRESSKPFFFSF